MRAEAILALLLLTLPLVGCPTAVDDDDDSTTDDDDSEPVEFAMWGPDHVSADTLDDNPHDCEQALPPEFSCFNPNPEIAWEGAPDGTVAFALIFDDPTAGNFAHWAIYNIPGDADGLDGDISGAGSGGDIPDGASELRNGANQVGYLGSCPSAGFINEYSWRLYALDAELTTDSGASFGQLESDAQDAEIEMIEMCHVFDGDNSDF